MFMWYKASTGGAKAALHTLVVVDSAATLATVAPLRAFLFGFFHLRKSICTMFFTQTGMRMLSPVLFSFNAPRKFLLRCPGAPHLRGTFSFGNTHTHTKRLYDMAKWATHIAGHDRIPMPTNLKLYDDLVFVRAHHEASNYDRRIRMRFKFIFYKHLLFFLPYSTSHASTVCGAGVGVGRDACVSVAVSSGSTST